MLTSSLPACYEKGEEMKQICKCRDATNLICSEEICMALSNAVQWIVSDESDEIIQSSKGISQTQNPAL
jgi:hypothetical protein